MPNRERRPERRTSPIWKISNRELQHVIDMSASFQDIMRYLGLVSSGASVRALKLRITEENLNIKGLEERRTAKRRQTPVISRQKPLDQILTKGSDYCRKSLKKRLIKSGLLVNQCAECANPPEWNGKPLVLQLDHINGVNNDNRLENLRLLCPNCHTQTDNFAGRQLRQVYLCKCGKTKCKGSENCLQCSANNQPCFLTIDDATLTKRIAVGEAYNRIAKEYNVSQTTVRKRCKKLGIYVNRQKHN